MKLILDGILFWRRRLAVRHVLLCAILCLASCFPAKDQPDFVAIDAGPFRAVYLIPSPDATEERVEVIVQAGEIDNVGPEGLAHYVEHLAWLPKLNPDRETSRHSNAMTNSVATRYFISGPAADLEANIGRLMDVFEPFQLTPDFMLEERGIVMREYDLAVLENPSFALYDEARQWLHQGTPMARSVIGTHETIERFSLEAAREFHRRTHDPMNAVLVVLGQTSERKLSRVLAGLEVTGAEGLGSAPNPLPPVNNTPDRKDTRVEVPGLSGEELHYQKIVPFDVDLSDPELAAAIDILTDMLDSGLPGGIAVPLRFDAFFARTYDIEIGQFSGTDLHLYFSARPDRGVSLEALLNAFEAALAAHGASGLPVETFKTVKERSLAAQGQVDWVAGETLSHVTDQVSVRRPPFGFSALTTAYESITLDEINALYRALLADGRTIVFRAVPPL